jgi:hypothetical protein
MLGCIVELQPPGDSPRLGRLEGLVQRSDPMGVQIIQHYPDYLSFWIDLIHQPLHLVGKVLRRATFCYFQVPPGLLRLKEHEQVACPITLVLVVVPFRPPWLDGLDRARIFNQLLTGLIQAHLGTLRVVGFFVQVQHILHTGHKLGAHLRNAPLLPLPGLKFAFFRSLRTCSWEMDSTISNSTTLSANNRKLQRACPSGGALQAMAMIWACCLPSSSWGLPQRGRSSSASSPSSTNRLRVRCTVARQMPTASAMCSSLKPSWALSKTCARLSLRAEQLPRRVMPSKNSLSSLLRSTLYLIFGMSEGSPVKNYPQTTPIPKSCQNYVDGVLELMVKFTFVLSLSKDEASKDEIR